MHGHQICVTLVNAQTMRIFDVLPLLSKLLDDE